MILFGLLAIPFVVGAVAYFIFHATITWKEYLLMVAISGIVAFSGYQISKWSGMQDTEHWNGRIVQKEDGTESCCHCTTVCDATDKDGNCIASHESCDHFQDYWWSISISTGNYSVHSINDNCNGFDRPPNWWTNAYVGEPAVVENQYTNYLKADPDSLMTPSAEKYLDQVPEFPGVYGKYKVKRVISDGVSVPPDWEKALNEMNADLGPKYQVDLLLILTKNQDPDFARSVEAKWLYGPKNAVTIVMGVPDGKVVDWARVVTVSDAEQLKVELRDGLIGKSITDPNILHFVESEIRQQFHRTPMAEYEYLSSGAEPSTGITIFLYIFNLLVVCGLAYFMHKEDVFSYRWNRMVKRGYW